MTLNFALIVCIFTNRGISWLYFLMTGDCNTYAMNARCFATSIYASIGRPLHVLKDRRLTRDLTPCGSRFAAPCRIQFRHAIRQIHSLCEEICSDRRPAFHQLIGAIDQLGHLHCAENVPELARVRRLGR
jgi:hypothetical protein